MITPLIDLSKLANYQLAYIDSAKACGFSSPGDINRFLFKSYGKAVREISPANRPKGAIFFLEPPATFGALAQIADLVPVLKKIRTDVARILYSVPLDLSGGATPAHEPNSDEHKYMVSGTWTCGHAQMLSRQTGRCVVWANGVSAVVFLAGDCYIESPDVVEELPIGIPASFDSFSWDDGKIVFEFAQHELNDTSATGIWHLPDYLLLKPKPEKLMSVGLGKFLRTRMAAYRHHDDEPYIENEGRADISLVLYNGFIYIIEVKWIGHSLKATRQLETEVRIKTALKKSVCDWVTKYGEEVFVTGAKQLSQYFGTGKYQRAYLVVFDCTPPSKKRHNESLPIDPLHVAPHNPADFRLLRACADPRKASVRSKA